MKIKNDDGVMLFGSWIIQVEGEKVFVMNTGPTGGFIILGLTQLQTLIDGLQACIDDVLEAEGENKS